MKKSLVLLSTVVICACLASCSGRAAEPTTTQKPTTSTTTRLATEEAAIKDNDAIELVKGYGAEKLGLSEKDMKECSFMVSKYGEEIEGERFVKVIATVKVEKEVDGETLFTLKNKGEYFISYDGEKVLSKNLEDNTYSRLAK